MPELGSANLVWLIPALPLLGFLFHAFLGKKFSKQVVGGIACLVVFLGMFMSVNIAGIVGTMVPLISKRAGFDPALTAGPFETAFQDVLGVTIFLSLATALLHWLI